MRRGPAAGLLLLVCWLPLCSGGAARGEDLAGAVELALARVPGLAAAKARAQAAGEAVRIAAADYLPSLDLSLAGRYGWRNEPTLIDRFSANYLEGEATLELRQRLFDGGLTAFGLAAAQADAEAAGHLAERTADDLAASVVEAYLAAYAGEQSVAIAAANLTDLRRLLGLVQQQEAAGLLTPTDRQQLQGRVALAIADLAEAEGRRQITAARLAALTGEPILLLSLPALPRDRLPADRGAALERALLASPWLAEAAALSRARTADREQGRARFWPAIDLVLAGRATNHLDGIEGQSAEALVLIELRWTLFDGFGREAEVRRLGHLGAAARGELLDRRRLLQGRIDRDFAMLAEGAGRAAALQPAVAAARETWRLYAEQFSIGRRSLLELLDARGDLARLEQQRLTAELLGPRAAYDLGAALGELRLWLTPQAVALPPAAQSTHLLPPVSPAPSVNAMTGQLLADLGAADLPYAEAPAPLFTGTVAIAPPTPGKLGAGPSLASLTAALLAGGPSAGSALDLRP